MADLFSVARWHGDDGCRMVLVKRGVKNLHLVVQDHPVHVVIIPMTDERHLTPVTADVQRVARQMRTFARNGNHTKAAWTILKEALT